MELDIIYEDSDLVAVNKPAGVVVHPDPRHASGTLIQALAERYPEICDVGEDPMRPGMVHRLDRDTSGILIVARNQRAFSFLKSAFQGHDIKKTYLALAVGRIKDDSGVIELPIGRSRKSPMKRIAGKGAIGKTREAVTRYRVRERLEGFTLVEAEPLTGRTHQIRAHFAALGYPLACDRLYAGGERFQCPAGLTRHFLHAWKLEFTAPSGAKLRLEADLPPDLEHSLVALGGKI
ncbi:MAG: RluA family pseudouridine synthase [Candidatus Niyogibacteria bacterium]|nr:RluA family pseudouridine synthase [Candidatus Niyogibacteria bacterium]